MESRIIRKFGQVHTLPYWKETSDVSLGQVADEDRSVMTAHFSQFHRDAYHSEEEMQATAKLFDSIGNAVLRGRVANYNI
jgi:hypothetical protein